MKELLKECLTTIGLLNSCLKCGEQINSKEDVEIKNLVNKLKQEIAMCEKN